MLKSAIIALAFATAGSIAASAQDTTVIHEHDGPAVTVTKPARPDVVVKERRDPSVTIKKEETVGRGGCDSKTVHRDGPEGSTTVKKERCD